MINSVNIIFFVFIIILVSFLQSAIIEYLPESVCAHLCTVCFHVFVFLHYNSKRNRSRNMKYIYIYIHCCI